MKTVPPIYKFDSQEEWEEYAWSRIIKGLTGDVSASDIKSALAMIITASERTNIIKRAVAISLLNQGKTLQEISKMLQISPGTVSAIRRSMEAGGGYVSAHEWNKSRRVESGKSLDILDSKKAKKEDFTKKTINIKFSFLFGLLFNLPPLPKNRKRKK